MPSPRKRKRMPSLDEEIPLWEFIHDHICVKKTFKSVGPALIRKYVEETNVPYTTQELSEFYSKSMVPALYKTELSPSTILTLYGALEIEISSHVEQVMEARFGAGIRLDADRHLVKFSIFGSPEYEKEHDETLPIDTGDMEPDFEPESEPPREEPVINVSMSDLEDLMWQHVDQHFNDSMTPEKLTSLEFWDLLRTSHPNHILPLKTGKQLHRHFLMNMLNHLWSQKVDPITKIRLIKEMPIMLNDEQREWILEHDKIDITIDRDDYVISWVDRREKAADPAPESPESSPPAKRKLLTWIPRVNPFSSSTFSSALPLVQTPPKAAVEEIEEAPTTSAPQINGNPAEIEQEEPEPVEYKPRRSRFTPGDQRVPFTFQDDEKAWKYILEKVAGCPKWNEESIKPKGLIFWDKFVDATKSPKSASNWSSHYRKVMSANLYSMPFPKNDTLKLYQKLYIQIDARTKAILERKFDVLITLSCGNFLEKWTSKGEENEEENEEEEAEEAENQQAPRASTPQINGYSTEKSKFNHRKNGKFARAQRPKVEVESESEKEQSEKEEEKEPESEDSDESLDALRLRISSLRKKKTTKTLPKNRRRSQRLARVQRDQESSETDSDTEEESAESSDSEEDPEPRNKSRYPLRNAPGEKPVKKELTTPELRPRIAQPSRSAPAKRRGRPPGKNLKRRSK